MSIIRFAYIVNPYGGAVRAAPETIMLDFSAGFFTLSDILEIAIELEKNGREFYEKAMNFVSDDRSRQLLEYLSQEEESHFHAFTRMKEETLDRAEGETQAPPGMESFIRESMAGKMLSWDERDDIDSSTPFHELMASALEFEEDTILFYRFMREMVGSDWEKSQIDRIIQEEQRHVERLSSYLTSQT